MESVKAYAHAMYAVILKARCPRSEKHHPGITDPSRLGELLKALDGYTGDFAVKRAIRLAPHLMLRPTELRAGLWSEIDLDNAVWRIPAERMKMKDGHIVPLDFRFFSQVSAPHLNVRSVKIRLMPHCVLLDSLVMNKQHMDTEQQRALCSMNGASTATT